MQTRKGSLVEAITNIVIGFSLNYGINLLTLPILWDPASPKLSAFYIGLVFTAVSLIRQYVIRRKFDGLKFGNRPMTEHERAEMKAQAGIR